MRHIDGLATNGRSEEWRDALQSRHKLFHRFSERLSVDPLLTRSLVSYQGNRKIPGFRWLKYKEGFSIGLVERFLAKYRPERVLDPFSGIGTVPLVAAWNNLSGTGIEIMPVGVRAAEGIAHSANGVSEAEFRTAAIDLIGRVERGGKAAEEYRFPHVRITEGAFSEETEEEIARAREFIAGLANPSIELLLDLACMTVLEASSFTRKDGQYLRWDYRSGRSLRSKFDIGPILSFHDALRQRLSQIAEDISILGTASNGGHPSLLVGSCLELLRQQPSQSIDLVMTSPPYANRYDYTRTYALELAWLGFGQIDFSRLRQSMLTATVENKSKHEWLTKVYGSETELLDKAYSIHGNQSALQEILAVLKSRARELSNRHVIRLLEGYFFEMAVVISELGRIVRPGGAVVMVNDNVQYHGEEVPVDFILSDFAEECGFYCTDIRMLPRGKGNSSQQMARFGRREIRKCVYEWVRNDS